LWFIRVHIVMSIRSGPATTREQRGSLASLIVEDEAQIGHAVVNVLKEQSGSCRDYSAANPRRRIEDRYDVRQHE
jgi:hypothetical protein